MYKTIINVLLSYLIIGCSQVVTAKAIDSEKIIATERVPAFIEYSAENVCDNPNTKFYITPLNINKDADLNDGILYGVMKDNNKNYSIKLVLRKNHLDSLKVYDNTLPLGVRGNNEVLNFSCSMLSLTSDLSNDESLCSLNKIFSYNENKIKDLNTLCSSNYRNSKIQRSHYMGNRFSNYLLANGFNIDFINRILKYKDIKNHGILDF
jgi:hypothetical protein